ncbi:peptidase M61 [Altererythrobacter endophyticus]|uniref:Peptidase M61 n=2 Tax=Altericroceibacterium endophyticum TaxID=1808508 RepID=A0A6I4T6T1_9SPHN|nr:peptidase M61 [Altericroceibacterium endophyticum]
MASPAVAAAQDAAQFAIELTPAAVDNEGAVRNVHVALTIDAVEADAGDALLHLPVMASTVSTAADRLTGLSASDASGPIMLTAHDDIRDDANVERRWSTDRAVSGTVQVSYDVPIDPHRPLIARPAYELRTQDSTFSGAGNAFLLLPEDDRQRIVDVDWQLDAIGADARGASSFGVGDLTTQEPYATGDLHRAYFMGGKPGLHQSADGRFFSVWQGEFGFPAEELMNWTDRLQQYYGDFFGYKPPVFGVFGRTNTLNPGSGIGLTHSFAFTFSKDLSQQDLRGLLAHEMLHAWVNSLDGSMDQAGGLAKSWFGEGLAVHYQRLLPYHAGLISAEDFLDDLNSTAGRYYTNALIDTPNSEVPAGFWLDTRIRTLPYDRGSLYFAKLDAQIRAKTQGQYSLDYIVRNMLAARRDGEPMDMALWKAWLFEMLGQQELDDFDAMLNGAVQVPPSDAFGRCFTRVTKKLQRFDLGFEPALLASEDRVIEGLDPASNAAAAGLRNGDKVLNSFPTDSLQGDQEAMVTLKLRRGEKELDVTYLPRGEWVDAYQWEQVPYCNDTGARSVAPSQ